MGLKENFLEYAKARIKKVPVELEGFGSVWVRVLKAGDLDKFQAMMVDHGKAEIETFRINFVSMCLCDEAGERIFSEKDFKQLADIPSDLLGQIFDKAYEINGFTVKAVEQAEKN